MLTLYHIIGTLGGMAVSLGVGSSTFALIFYFMAKHNSSLRETGRPYQKAVYIVLRVAMGLILVTEIAKVFLYMQEPTFSWNLLFAEDALMFMWTIVLVLFANAALMTLHYMPMKIGPAIQATSWYALGIITTFPFITSDYLPLLLLYLGAIVAMAVVIEVIGQKVAPKEAAVEVAETVVVAIASPSDTIEE